MCALFSRHKTSRTAKNKKGKKKKKEQENGVFPFSFPFILLHIPSFTLFHSVSSRLSDDLNVVCGEHATLAVDLAFEPVLVEACGEDNEVALNGKLRN